jgi:hypothetical protein
MLNNNRLKMRLFLCDAYVTEQKIKILSGINFLFDCITSWTTKNVINNSFSMRCLFNGYLTESIGYPHLAQMACLTGSVLKGLKTYLNALFTRLSLFTGYLIELHFNAHGGLSKM